MREGGKWDERERIRESKRASIINLYNLHDIIILSMDLAVFLFYFLYGQHVFLKCVCTSCLVMAVNH